MISSDKYGIASLTIKDMAIIFKNIKIPVRAFVGSKSKIRCVLKVKQKLLNFIKGKSLYLCYLGRLLSFSI